MSILCPGCQTPQFCQTYGCDAKRDQELLAAIVAAALKVKAAA